MRVVILLGSTAPILSFQHNLSLYDQHSTLNRPWLQKKYSSPCAKKEAYDANKSPLHQHFPNKVLDDDQDAPNRLNIDTRRSFLSGSIFAGSLLSLPNFANAAKGAAEYDLEFYLRDLVQGNSNPGGNISVSTAPPKPPARTLMTPLLPLLLEDFTPDSDDMSYHSIPAILLADILAKTPNPEISSLSQIVNKFLTPSKRGFASKAQWKTESVSDQYYFDVTAYALWRSAAKIIPNFAARDVFVKNMGREIYQRGKDSKLFTRPKELPASTISAEASEKNNKKNNTANNGKVTFEGPLTRTIPALTELMDTFTTSNFCGNYRLGDTKNELDKIGGYLFDVLDDEEISSNGYSIDCLISVYEPSTLNAALQITAEGSRFSPDYIGPTLVAMWEDYGIKAIYETYFVDQEYRPNPKDFFPNEQLYQFSLSLMKK